MPRYLVQVAVLRPDEPDARLVERIASLDHGEVRELEDVVNVWLHVDATDREINEALYGNAPPGGDYLVIGHESFGRVLAVGDRVTEVRPGDYVSCTVRRPGKSIHDLIGRNDVTGEETYYERGINLCHGYMTERFVDDAEYIVKEQAGEPLPV